MPCAARRRNTSAGACTFSYARTTGNLPMTIRALHVASELYPLLKTGGLADVAGALPPALIERGADVRVLLPGFPAVIAGLSDLRTVAQLGRRFDAPHVTLEQGTLASSDLVVYVIRADSLYDRPGNPY